MSFERILSFFTEHAPELLLAFVLWWASTAPAAMSTPLQSPTLTAAPTALRLRLRRQRRRVRSSETLR